MHKFSAQVNEAAFQVVYQFLNARYQEVCFCCGRTLRILSLVCVCVCVYVCVCVCLCPITARVRTCKGKHMLRGVTQICMSRYGTLVNASISLFQPVV